MKIPGYTIRRRLGSGGQALVYLAIQESLERQVALKVLHPVHSDSPEFSARFLNEARILANLGHSNVITIHDIGVEGELHYLSMELVEGGDLKQRIRNGLEVPAVLDYLTIIADCLATAHHKHIVHRDIKPANVLFRSDGTLLVTDFGIAKQLDSDGELTVSGTTMGSPHYLSPEQAQGRPLDGRADIYSLGAMAFEMLTGRKPYPAASEIDTIFQHINAPLPILPERFAHLQPLIERTMAKSPEDRFDNAFALRDYLRELQDSIRPGLPPRDLAPPPAPELKTPSAAREHATEVCMDAAKDQAGDPGHGALRSPGAESLRPSVGMFAVAALLLVGAWMTLTDGNSGSASDTDNAFLTSGPGRFPIDLDSTPAQRQESKRATLQYPQAPAATPPALHIAIVGPPPGERRAEDVSAALQAVTSQRITTLLDQAAAAIEELRLTRPENDNAFAYYQQVLELDPQNSPAREGVASIAQRYAVMARAEMERNKISKAGDFVRRGLAVDDSNEDLLVLQASLAQGVDTDEPAGSEVSDPRSEDIVDATEVVPAKETTRRYTKQATASSEIRGESPRQLFRRIKSWFN